MKTELPLVIVSHALPEDWLESLDGRCNIVSGPVEYPGFFPALERSLPEAQGLITLLTDRIDQKLLQKAPLVKVISNMAAGTDNIDIAYCSGKKIPVGNTPGVLTDATADLTMSLLLTLARKIPAAMDDARKGKWHTWLPAGWLGFDLSGSVMGIVGLGKIGLAVARRAVGFGIKVIYTDDTPRPELEDTLGLRRVGFNELLEQSDIVSLHCPLTADTRGMMDANSFKRMKKTAILLNAARGAIINTDALYHALKKGWIFAAGLDVTDPEPLPPTHPLYQLENCIIVPHIGSATLRTRKTMAKMACDNLLAGLHGEKLPNCVNPEIYK